MAAPPNAQVRLQALYTHRGEAASEECLSAATFVRRLGDDFGLSEDWPHQEIPRLGG